MKGLGFIGLHMRKVESIENIDHAHYMLPLCNSFEGKVLLYLLNPKFDSDLAYPLEFEYTVRKATHRDLHRGLLDNYSGGCYESHSKNILENRVA